MIDLSSIYLYQDRIRILCCRPWSVISEGDPDGFWLSSKYHDIFFVRLTLRQNKTDVYYYNNPANPRVFQSAATYKQQFLGPVD